MKASRRPATCASAPPVVKGTCVVQIRMLRIVIRSVAVGVNVSCVGKSKGNMTHGSDKLQTSEGGSRRGAEVGSQRALVAHAVLTGLTPLIPLPLVDDLAKNYFRRRLVRGLGAASGRGLSDDEASALLKEKGRGCLLGCLSAALVYPLKAVFRKVFYFLEWKRAVDLASRTYHFGYLTAYALRPREGGATLVDLCGAEAVGQAIQTVCREAPIRPVEAAIAGTFRGSRRGLRAAANLLASPLRSGEHT